MSRVARPFTSDLSMDEVLLLDEMGFEPVDLVFGTSYYHIGFQQAAWSSNTEIDTMTRAMIDARESAMQRLMTRVAECGADGVVGVRIEIDHENDHANFLAIGTAVRTKDRTQSHAWRLRDGLPFSSDLSGQDFYALARAGFKPRTLVMGNCVYHVAHQSLGAWMKTSSWQNVELETFTVALYEAREIAMERMQKEATAVGATGIVGVDVREGQYGWSSHVIEFLAVGTAIAPTGVEPTHGNIFPMYSLSESQE